MLKVLAACGNGMGSSMVVKMKVEMALRKMGVSDFKTDSCSIAEAKGMASQYDVVIASKHLISELQGRTQGHLVGLDNLMDDKEISEKLSEVLHV
ncbi:PTS ascorbate transporter subunit IIB [Granulicatella sp. zg-ZJ]|uniref:PTS sugar transporter subunit IIB n=1 Tax=unclassified Granulicatella TaxID=2630493 RepID=UPI0013C14272|nr:MULTISPECIES: PTS sugar transporter subunit IIB [unclassified Granulicatella]MBS4750056.1 PTS sugar transporter subunit IIB [Carnobacteriaceae bacterium zg-ZUI78]NEW62643.1 PTS ascorbate transporter subunit IIB [Granulicatella sp. zg-ZJ]NEW65788.1 PTS ascorbate transporter subunit IIB [Granulicatella sp. zg-84]QMI86295.1 PTS sugar transporter subunit IIB [Carnobacteriaceae bacterium zg-84]